MLSCLQAEGIKLQTQNLSEVSFLCSLQWGRYSGYDFNSRTQLTSSIEDF